MKKKILYSLGALILWSVPGLIQASQEVYYANLTGRSYGNLWLLVLHMVPRWWLWAMATPLVIKLARRWRPNSDTWRRVVLIHIVLAVLMAAVVIILIILYGVKVRVWGNPAPFIQQLRFGLWTMIPFVHFMAYWAICGLTWVFDGEQAIREKELVTARLEAQLTSSKLQALQMQLHPHFLFNTLNSVSVLMADDTDAAQKMLRRLGNLLRRTLSLGNQHLISLADEMEIIREYLAIESIRFADRLTVEINIDEDCLSLQVPVMILQPLVENALGHGVSQKPGPARLEIIAIRQGNRLEIMVVDDGIGYDGESPERIGLGNTRARLQELFDDDFDCSLEQPQAGGTRVRVSWPALEMGHE